jgi:hypothetical protein
MNTWSYQIQHKVIYLFTKLDSIYPKKKHICIDGNKKVVQCDAKAKVHLITWFINFLKHNEIGTGHVTNMGGLDIYIYFPISLCVQEEYVMQNPMIWKTKNYDVCAV